MVIVLAQAVTYGTPILFAALGELLAERSGVLNLGVEGMMLVGAVMGFWTVQRLHANTGLSLAAAIGVAALAGAAMATIHAFLVITLRASQIVSGLALTIFAGAAGLSSYLGNDFNLADNPARHQFHAVFPASFQKWPVVGPIVFGQNVLVYASWACVVAVWLYLSRTRPGLNVRAVGESPAAAHAVVSGHPRASGSPTFGKSAKNPFRNEPRAAPPRWSARAGVLGRARSLGLRTLPASLARGRPSHPDSACSSRNGF